LDDPAGPIFFGECTVPLAPPAPHCTDKVMELSLVYIGDFFGEGGTLLLDTAALDPYGRS